MARAKVVLTVLALLIGVERANADLIYSFTYTDGTGNAAHGTVTAVDSGLGDGSLHAISGTLTVTSSADGNGSVGTYSLLSIGPNVTTSPAGAFIVDNLIYPNNNAGNGVNSGGITNPSFLTNWGLLFGQPGTGSQTEVNFWGNGNGDYALFTFNSSGYNIQQGGGGSFSVTLVPEPTTLAVFGMCLVGAVGFAYRRRGRIA